MVQESGAGACVCYFGKYFDFGYMWGLGSVVERLSLWKCMLAYDFGLR